jgi:hypothetical protein
MIKIPKLQGQGIVPEPDKPMFTNFSKKIEIVANLAIIAVACLLAFVLVRNYVSKKEAGHSIEQSESQSFKGVKLPSLGIDWRQSKQTLVLAISDTCHFCTESAPFYQKLVQTKGNTRTVAVLPQSVQAGQEYLRRLGVSVDEIRQLGLNTIGVQGTPTLLLVDDSGVVTDAWVGELSSEKQGEVLSRLQSNRLGS